MKKLFHRSIKDVYYSLCADLTTSVCDLKSHNYKPSKSDKALLSVSAITGAIFYGPMTAFAAKPTLFEKAESLLSDYYSYFFSLTTLIAVVAAIIGVLYCMISGEEGTRKGIKFVKKVALSWLVINLFGGIISIMEDLTEGQHFKAS